jgi:hypothetical protein
MGTVLAGIGSAGGLAVAVPLAPGGFDSPADIGHPPASARAWPRIKPDDTAASGPGPERHHRSDTAALATVAFAALTFGTVVLAVGTEDATSGVVVANAFAFATVVVAALGMF